MVDSVRGMVDSAKGGATHNQDGRQRTGLFDDLNPLWHKKTLTAIETINVSVFPGTGMPKHPGAQSQAQS